MFAGFEMGLALFAEELWAFEEPAAGRFIRCAALIFYCCECGRTHRELPHFLIPYKRYSANAIYDILFPINGAYECETSTRCRLWHWWRWFCLCLWQFGECRKRRKQAIEAYVRIAVNSGFWRSAVCWRALYSLRHDGLGVTWEMEIDPRNQNHK